MADLEPSKLLKLYNLFNIQHIKYFLKNKKILKKNNILFFKLSFIVDV